MDGGSSEEPPAPMEDDNAAGNRNDLGSNGEEEPVPGGPVVAANAGAMGEPDRAGRLLDDNFWEDNDLQEGEPAGFLSSLNGSDDDTTDEEPAQEEDEEQEGEQRQQPEAATQEGGAEEVGNGTKDPDDERELPECFSHELIGKPPKNSSIGGVLVDLLGVKADYELPTAAYEEILYILNTALGNDMFPKIAPASLKALDEPSVASCMECEAPRFVQPYRQDLSKHAFLLNSDFGRQLKEATDGAIADAANLIMDVGIDGVQLTKFKHHSATVYVSRVANVPRHKLTGRGYHAAFFACMWCLFHGIHLDGAVRFLGYFAAAAQTLWHQAFNPILPPGNGVRDTRARQEGEAHKRCITEVLRDPGRQCVQSCFAGADGSMLTDTELEALQRASAPGKLPKGLTGSAHADAAVYARLGETEASLLGRILETDNAIDNLRLDGAANLVRYFRKVIVGKCSKDPERVFAVEVMKQMRLEDFELLYNDMVTSMRRDRGSKSTTAKKAHAALGAVGGAVSKARVQEEFCEEGVDVHAHTIALFKTDVEEFGPDGLKVQDIREDTTNIKMTYYGRMEALKPDQESYTVYCSRAYSRLPKGNAWAENHDMFQEIMKVEWCSYVKHSHTKDIAALDEDDGGVDAGQ
eukprot:jgi/Tetstr1/437512/TSEL_026190.t1